MAIAYENISSDIARELTRKNKSLLRQHIRNHASYVTEQAIGIKADDNTVELKTKLPKRSNYPSKLYQTSSFSASTPSRKLYCSVVNSTAKKGYRSDLRAEAVARASAVKQSQKEKRVRAALKPRGKKALAKAQKAVEGSA